MKEQDMLKNFYPVDMLIKMYSDHLNMTLSKEFIDCADTQLSQDFTLRTGIKINKEIGLSPMIMKFSYEVGSISRMHTSLIINNYGNDVYINWKSKSGRIYATSDTDIDCNDVDFWLDGLDPLEYHKQLQPNNTLPFKLKELTYELIITNLNMDMSVEMFLKDEFVPDTSALIKVIDKKIDDYNIKSLKKDRKDGVVHNWKRRIENDRLVYEIDTGSAGAIFLKKFLIQLSKLGAFTNVEIS